MTNLEKCVRQHLRKKPMKAKDLEKSFINHQTRQYIFIGGWKTTESGTRLYKSKRTEMLRQVVNKTLRDV